MELTAGTLLDVTGAGLVLDPPGETLATFRQRVFTGVAIDSRRVAPGDLFVALPGTRTDGAHFIADAFARGALAALTPWAPAITAERRAARAAALGTDAPFAALVVPDALAALGQAAMAWRQRHDDVCVVGVTGSIGKTTTREAIAGVLAVDLPTLVSERSYNNEIGLPLTLLRLEQRHRAAVLEMGMYAAGEIAALATMARPRIGVVTMVAPVHLERLGSIEAIAAAKAELVQALPVDGVAILNGDDELVRAMAVRTAARVITFGLGDDNDWRAQAIEGRGLDGFAFTVARGGWTARVETGVVGTHFVHALLAAAAVAEEFGLSPERIASLLGRARIGERQRFLQGAQDRLIIDDSWNASMPSVLAALDVLAAVPRRRVVALGEMRELGAGSEAAHRAVGRRVAAVAQALVAIGPGGVIAAAEARQAGMPSDAVLVVAEPREAPGALETLLQPGDVVLVKGSRALRLEETVAWLMGVPGYEG